MTQGRKRTHPIWQRVDEVCALYIDGATLEEIAAKFYCKYWQVHSVLVANEVPRRRWRGDGTGPRKYTLEKVCQINELREIGLRWEEIGVVFNMSAPGAFKLAKRWAA